MTREDIIRMAREAGWKDLRDYDLEMHNDFFMGSTNSLVAFAALVAGHERERLAKVFDERDKDIGWYDPGEPAEIIRGQA